MPRLLTTSELRSAWGPACVGPWARLTLFGGATVSVSPLIVEAVKAADAVYRHHGYQSRPADTGAFNCRRITGGSGYSLHSYGIAIDRNWSTNPYGHTLVTDRPAGLNADEKAIRTNNGAQVWGWGGDYSGNKDAMHSEIRCSPADLATGINWSTVAGHTPSVPASKPTTTEDDMPYTPEELSLLMEQAAEKGATKALQGYMAAPDNRLFKFLRELVGKSKG